MISPFVLASVISALVLAFGLLVGLLPLSAPGGTLRNVLPENAALFYDNSRQLRVHKGILLGMTLAIFVLFRSKGGLPRLENLIRYVSRPRALWRAVTFVTPWVVLSLALRDLPNAKGFLLVLVSLALLVWVGSRFGDRVWMTVAVGAGLVLCSTIMIVPGFATVPDLSAGSSIPADEAEVHYSIVVSQGDRLSQGRRLFTNVVPHYGFLEPFSLAVTERVRGLLDFGKHIRVVQAMQVAFALSAFFCYWAWSRRKLLATTVAFLPILGYVHTSHMSVFCPNQSGWRFLGLPLGLLLLVVARPSAKRDAPLLGFALGALLLFNPETGIVICSAYLTYIISGRCRSPEPFSAMAKSLLLFGLSIAILPVAFIPLYRAFLGYYPFPEAHGPSYALARFAGGYGGLKIYFGIGWIVILVHSVFEISRSLLSIDRLNIHRRLRLSIAVAILLWFVYFANRPHTWNLWTYWFLYGFFIVDFVRPGSLARFRRALRRGRLPMPLSVVGVFAAAGIFVVMSGLRDNLRIARARASVPSTVLSGVRFTPSYAAAAQARADFVRQAAKETSVLYFTSNTYLMPLLSGVVSDLPFSDPYVESFTMDDFEGSVAWIKAKDPEELLFDDPAAEPKGSVERNIFIARLKDRLSSTYHPSGRASAWEIWRHPGTGIPGGKS